jgi:hypothetical protein
MHGKYKKMYTPAGFSYYLAKSKQLRPVRLCCHQPNSSYLHTPTQQATFTNNSMVGGSIYAHIESVKC